jgi:hypothetical protein
VCYTHVGKRSTLERCDEATLVMSKKSDHCANRNTERYGIYRRGYCEFCYRLIVQKEEVERWDLKDPSTLKRVPGIASYSQRRFEEEFPKIKAARLKELEYRLWLRKTKEAQRNAKVTGIDIEHAFRRLAKYSCGKEDAVYNIASMVNAYFDQRARRTLLGWLFDIEESMRWDAKRYWHALYPEEVGRIVAQNRAESGSDFENTFPKLNELSRPTTRT